MSEFLRVHSCSLFMSIRFSISLLLVFVSVNALLVEDEFKNHLIKENFPYDYLNISNVLISTSIQKTNISNFSYLCDMYGPRYRGTSNLEQSLDYIFETMREQGLENVRKEPVVNITNWSRGEEFLRMIKPRSHRMSMLGLGTSVGTNMEGGLIAEAFVVSSFEDLSANASKAKGKIVVFNAPFVTYGETVSYRVNGASEAAKVGAVAVLIRSVTPFSLNTPHTGVMRYLDGIKKIPAAAITIEDAELMARMQNRGTKIVLQLYMEAQTLPMTSSYNVIAELIGRENANEVIVIGGHSDSWDVGQGAIDDGGGLFSSWEALRLISFLVKSGEIPRPRRTIRVVLWVDEEIGQRGAKTYAETYKNDLNNHIFAIESDSGNFNPTGFGFSGSQEAFTLVEMIGEVLLSSIGSGNITFGDGSDVDNGSQYGYLDIHL